jgi:hypothetical protein
MSVPSLNKFQYRRFLATPSDLGYEFWKYKLSELALTVYLDGYTQTVTCNIKCGQNSQKS